MDIRLRLDLVDSRAIYDVEVEQWIKPGNPRYEFLLDGIKKLAETDKDSALLLQYLT